MALSFLGVACGGRQIDETRPPDSGPSADTADGGAVRDAGDSGKITTPCGWTSFGKSGDVTTRFVDAMVGISSEALLCTFDIPTVFGGNTADLPGIAVTYTPNATRVEAQIPKLMTVDDCALNGGDGWFFDFQSSPTKVQICPGTCAKLMTGEVHVASGCTPIIGTSR
jgi:hypothetical protein